MKRRIRQRTVPGYFIDTVEERKGEGAIVEIEQMWVNEYIGSLTVYLEALWLFKARLREARAAQKEVEKV